MSDIREAKNFQSLFTSQTEAIDKLESKRINHWVSKSMFVLSFVLPFYVGMAVFTFSDIVQPKMVVENVKTTISDGVESIILLLCASGLFGFVGLILFSIIYSAASPISYDELEEIRKEFNLYLKTVNWDELDEDDEQALKHINNVINAEADGDDDLTSLLLFTNTAIVSSKINSSIDC